MTPTITAQVLVANEENWVWFALNSVLPYVDQIIVWDTGSTDKTVEIIKSISNSKIKFFQKGLVDSRRHSQLRQHMLEQTDTDWFLILDGDEIWWQSSIVKVIKTIRENPHKAAVISPFYNAVGDIFHYQNPSRSSYQIHQYLGSYTIRAINRKLPGLYLTNPHGRQEYRTEDIPLQKLPADKLLLVDAPYLHVTHLRRSNSDIQTLKRSFKFKYELGSPADTFPPDVFYFPRPSLVSNPFLSRSMRYSFLAAVAEPIRQLKGFIISNSTSGY